MPKDIKAGDIIKSQREREKKRENIYKNIYTLIENKILQSSKSDYYYTYYEVPSYVYGLPIYNVEDCIDYVTRRLEKNDFTVKYQGDYTILITWTPID